MEEGRGNHFTLYLNVRSTMLVLWAQYFMDQGSISAPQERGSPSSHDIYNALPLFHG